MASLEPSVSDSRDYIFNMMIRANNIVQDIYQYAKKIDTNKSFLSEVVNKINQYKGGNLRDADYRLVFYLSFN